MAEKNRFTKNDIETIGNALETSPDPERSMTKVEALDELAEKLKALRKRGRTFASLVELLMSLGLKTHVRAVRESIARLDSSKIARARKTKRKVS